MSVREWARAYHFARIERFAATLVRDENISLACGHVGRSFFGFGAWVSGVGVAEYEVGVADTDLVSVA